MKLYEMIGEWRFLSDAIDEAEGEMPPEIESRLDALNESLEDKTDSICGLIRQWAGEVVTLEGEAHRLQAMAASRKRNIERLKTYLHDTLVQMGRDKVCGELFKARVCRNSRPSISFTGQVLDCPTEFLRFDPAVDNQHAYEVWKMGCKLPPGFVVHEGTHLRIT